MATSRSNALVCAALLGGAALLAAGSAAADDAVSLLIDSFCFSRQHGGYLLHSTLPDGSLRFTAEAGSSTGALRWGIELVMTPQEERAIWEQAIKAELTPAELAALANYCRPDNLALKEGFRKQAFNRFAESRPAFEQDIRSTLPNFPSLAGLNKQVLSSEEEAAVTALRNDPVASAAYTKLGLLPMNRRIQSGFLEIANQRARHIPWVNEDHQDERTRQFFRQLKPQQK